METATVATDAAIVPITFFFTSILPLVSLGYLQHSLSEFPLSQGSQQVAEVASLLGESSLLAF